MKWVKDDIDDNDDDENIFRIQSKKLFTFHRYVGGSDDNDEYHGRAGVPAVQEESGARGRGRKGCSAEIGSSTLERWFWDWERLIMAMVVKMTHKCWRAGRDEERDSRSEESRGKNQETWNAP